MGIVRSIEKVTTAVSIQRVLTGTAADFQVVGIRTTSGTVMTVKGVALSIDVGTEIVTAAFSVQRVTTGTAVGLECALPIASIEGVATSTFIGYEGVVTALSIERVTAGAAVDIEVVSIRSSTRTVMTVQHVVLGILTRPQVVRSPVSIE